MPEPVPKHEAKVNRMRQQISRTIQNPLRAQSSQHTRDSLHMKQKHRSRRTKHRERKKHNIYNRRHQPASPEAPGARQSQEAVTGLSQHKADGLEEGLVGHRQEMVTCRVQSVSAKPPYGFRLLDLVVARSPEARCSERLDPSTQRGSSSEAQRTVIATTAPPKTREARRPEKLVA